MISPSTLGVFSHYGCARLLLRLAKRNEGLDYRVRATEASRGSTATKAFDSGAAIIAGEALTDRDVSEAAAALSMVSLVSGRGTDHERWLNTQLEDRRRRLRGLVHIRGRRGKCRRSSSLVDVEKLARRRAGKFEDAYDALSLELLRDAPVGTALYQPALNVKLIGERGRVSVALGLLDAFDRGDVSLSRALVDYVLVVLDAGRRSLVVIDAKASRKVKLEHQIQVAAYTMLIDVAFGRTDFMATAPGVCRVGGVWLPAKASPQIFEVGGLQKKVRELLATKVNDLLTADAHARDFDTDTDDWVLRGSCETCNFRASCEKQAADRGRLCALPGLRADDAVELQSFSAGAAGRNAIERLETAVRTVDPSTRTKSTRRALRARDPSPVRGRRAAKRAAADAPSLARKRDRAHGPAVGVFAVPPRRGGRLRLHLRRRALPEPRAHGPRRGVRASHHGVLWKKSRVVSYSPFAGDAHANAAVGHAREDADRARRCRCTRPSSRSTDDASASVFRRRPTSPRSSTRFCASPWRARRPMSRARAP